MPKKGGDAYGQPTSSAARPDAGASTSLHDGDGSDPRGDKGGVGVGVGEEQGTEERESGYDAREPAKEL